MSHGFRPSRAEGLDAAIAGYGRIMLQRFAVPLDAKVDPTGPPVAAGLDGVAGGDADAAVNVAAAIGRDVAVASDHADNDTLVAWIDAAGVVHARLYTVNGNPITTASGAITGVNLDNIGTAAGSSDVKVISSGAGFVVAWTDAAGIIRSEIFTGGGASTFTASAAALLNTAVLPGGSVFTGEFAIGALLDTNGFALTVGAQKCWQQGPVHPILQCRRRLGRILTLLNTTVAGDQNAPALAGLIGDRIIAVYQDDPTANGGDQDIRAVIVDTHTAGVVLNGDPVGGGGGGHVHFPTCWSEQSSTIPSAASPTMTNSTARSATTR